ncbi:MAG: hypothetical protein ACREIC_03190 [Limisphaerales bacterium]
MTAPVFFASIFLAAAALLSQATFADSPNRTRPAVFFVATNGNDNWSGTNAWANSTRAEGPFATLPRALAASRAWRHAFHATNNTVRIVLREGVYYLTEPLVLTPEDSGLVLAAYPNEKPVLSGGRLVTGWEATTVNGRAAWVAEIPDVRRGKWAFHELWVNGGRAPPARHPAHGFLRIAGVPDKTPAWNIGSFRFQFHPGDLMSTKAITNAELVVMSLWMDSHLPVASVDESNHIINFSKRPLYRMDPGDLYYLQGAIDFLDQPGQWCLDSSAGRLYYLPRPGETLNEFEAVAPVLAQLIRFDGDPGHRQWVERVRTEGLTFSHTEWYFPRLPLRSRNNTEIAPAPDPVVGQL